VIDVSGNSAQISRSARTHQRSMRMCARIARELGGLILRMLILIPRTQLQAAGRVRRAMPRLEKQCRLPHFSLLSLRRRSLSYSMFRLGKEKWELKYNGAFEYPAARLCS
jgi:hypothetical protein